MKSVGIYHLSVGMEQFVRTEDIPTALQLCHPLSQLSSLYQPCLLLKMPLNLNHRLLDSVKCPRCIHNICHSNQYIYTI